MARAPEQEFKLYVMDTKPWMSKLQRVWAVRIGDTLMAIRLEEEPTGGEHGWWVGLCVGWNGWSTLFKEAR